MTDKRLSRKIIRNKEEMYKETFRKRGVKHIDHYPSPRLHHPTVDELVNIETVSHVWKTGDRYSKLAFEFYDDARLWWVIAWFNQLPTESHVNFGDVIYIPVPIERALEVLRG